MNGNYWTQFTLIPQLAQCTFWMIFINNIRLIPPPPPPKKKKKKKNGQKINTTSKVSSPLKNPIKSSSITNHSSWNQAWDIELHVGLLGSGFLKISDIRDLTAEWAQHEQKNDTFQKQQICVLMICFVKITVMLAFTA